MRRVRVVAFFLSVCESLFVAYSCSVVAHHSFYTEEHTHVHTHIDARLVLPCELCYYTRAECEFYTMYA